MNGVDKSFQQKQGAPQDTGKQTKKPPQPMDDCQAEEIARRKAEVENVRRKVGEAIRLADGRTVKRWEALVKERVNEEARVAELKATAEDEKCKAEAAEREAEAAKVVVLEAWSALEKAAASEVVREARKTASDARGRAERARVAAGGTARKAAWSWVM